MRNFLRIASVSTALLAVACGRQSAMDEQMQKDLEAASAATMEMAPNGAGTKVVSAIEQTGKVRPQVTKARRTVAPARTPPPQTPQPTNVNVSTEPTATRPVSAPPRVQPCPPGGCITVDEAIRNAPFPIKPATKRPS
ncbi:MAG: hypothetical protein WD825_16545 [Gemmatimonadaceae bacterium]